jgi:hypothetical protein
MKDNLSYLNIVKITKIAEKRPDPKNPSKKIPTVAIQCDICSSLKKEGNRYKQADKDDFDLCEECFIGCEIKTSTEDDAYKFGLHPFWVIKGFQEYVFE